MEVGIVKIAEDSDFRNLKALVDGHNNWNLEYTKNDDIKVWTQIVPDCDIRMVKVHAILKNITPEVLFDVLHDPEYRKEWDVYMIESTEVGYLNPNNDLGYYAISCPPPLKNRDFVLQRSWLDMQNEKLILNHSVFHRSYPPKKGFVRATSHLTGFVIRTYPGGCFLGYISQTDPKGKIPPWLVNKCTQIFAPKLIKQLLKAAEGYTDWKTSQSQPELKPWTYPEQTMLSPRISVTDCVDTYNASSVSSLTRDSDCDDVP